MYRNSRRAEPLFLGEANILTAALIPATSFTLIRHSLTRASSAAYRGVLCYFNAPEMTNWGYVSMCYTSLEVFVNGSCRWKAIGSPKLVVGSLFFSGVKGTLGNYMRVSKPCRYRKLLESFTSAAVMASF